MTEETKRALLPTWPRLMSVEYAALYLSLSATTMRSLNIKAARVGRPVLYDRRDLDAWADQLGGRAPSERDHATQSTEVERRFLEKHRRLNAGPTGKGLAGRSSRKDQAQ